MKKTRNQQSNSSVRKDAIRRISKPSRVSALSQSSATSQKAVEGGGISGFNKPKSLRSNYRSRLRTSHGNSIYSNDPTIIVSCPTY